MGTQNIQVYFSGKMQDLQETCLQQVEHPWTSQMTPCLFATELTHIVCRKRTQATLTDEPVLHTTFHGGSGSSKSFQLHLCPGKGVWPSVPSSYITLQGDLCQAEGPSQGDLGSGCQLQAPLQSSCLTELPRDLPSHWVPCSAIALPHHVIYHELCFKI